MALNPKISTDLLVATAEKHISLGDEFLNLLYVLQIFLLSQVTKSKKPESIMLRKGTVASKLSI